jgi:lysophospholipase L1-like esterase
VNAFGLRGPERAPRGADEVRVLCLGDSFVYGQGVAESDTISAQLERVLADRRATGARPVTVWNGGHRGYNTEQELALLEELVPGLDPDVVVLVWYPNDLEEVDVAGAARRLTESGPITFDTGARFEGAVARNWRLKQAVRHSALAMRLHDLVQDSRSAAPVAAEGVERGFTRLAASLERFATLAREHDFDALVAVLPDSDSVSRDGEPAAQDRVSVAPAGDAPSATARVLALASSAVVPAVDLCPALRAQRRREGRLHVLAYDGHYDGRAYATVAEQLADELEHRFAGRLGR